MSAFYRFTSGLSRLPKQTVSPTHTRARACTHARTDTQPLSYSRTSRVKGQWDADDAKTWRVQKNKKNLNIFLQKRFLYNEALPLKLETGVQENIWSSFESVNETPNITG